MSAPAGITRITHGGNYHLTSYGDNAVAGEGQERNWKIRYAGGGGERGPVTISSIDSRGEEKCLTLQPGWGGMDECEVYLRPLQSPPLPEQMWVVEECIVQPSMPPIALGRFSNCARKDWSAALGGNSGCQAV